MFHWLVPAATFLSGAGLARVAAGFPTLAFIQEDESNLLETLLEFFKNGFGVLQWVLETKVLGLPRGPFELITKLFPGDLSGDFDTAYTRIYTPPSLEGSLWGIVLLAAGIIAFLLLHFNFGWWFVKMIRAIRTDGLKRILAGKAKGVVSPLIYPVYNYAIPLVVVMLGFLLMQLAFNLLYQVLGEFIGLLYEGTSLGVATFQTITNILSGWGFIQFTAITPALYITFLLFMAFLIMRFLLIPVKGIRMLLWVSRYSHRSFVLDVVKHEGWNVVQSYISLFLMLAILAAIPVSVNSPPFSIWGGITIVIPAMLGLAVIIPWILFGFVLIPTGIARWLRPKGEYNEPGVDWEKHAGTVKKAAPNLLMALLTEIPEAAIAIQLIQSARNPSRIGSAIGGGFQAVRTSTAGVPQRTMTAIPAEEAPKPRQDPRPTLEGRSRADDYLEPARSLGAEAKSADDEIFGFASVMRSSDQSSFDELARKAYDKLNKMSPERRQKWADMGRELKDKLEGEL